jgi:hypothetical protein
MSRRNIKPTTFHDDSRSSDAGSVVNAAPPRAKTRTVKDPARDLLALREHRVDPRLDNGIPPTLVKPPPIGPDGEIQVYNPSSFATADIDLRSTSTRCQSKRCRNINTITIYRRQNRLHRKNEGVTMARNDIVRILRMHFLRTMIVRIELILAHGDHE